MATDIIDAPARSYPADRLNDREDPVPADVLRRLRTSTGRDRLLAVLDAEVADLSDDDERASVLPLLWQFILDTRDSGDKDEQIAAAAAVRRYVAAMNVADVGSISPLFDATAAGPTPLWLEHVLAKMVYRKFEANPPAVPDVEPDLAERVDRLATAYSDPEVLSDMGHAAVASFAVEALVAMRSSSAVAALTTVAASPSKWFRDYVGRDLDHLAAAWASKDRAAGDWCATLKRTTLG